MNEHSDKSDAEIDKLIGMTLRGSPAAADRLRELLAAPCGKCEEAHLSLDAFGVARGAFGHSVRYRIGLLAESLPQKRSSGDVGSLCPPERFNEAKARVMCDWPQGQFSVNDDPDPHKPCYLVCPDGAAVGFSHHNGEGVDKARVEFIAQACNAALSARAPTVPTHPTGWTFEKWLALQPYLEDHSKTAPITKERMYLADTVRGAWIAGSQCIAPEAKERT